MSTFGDFSLHFASFSNDKFILLSKFSSNFFSAKKKKNTKLTQSRMYYSLLYFILSVVTFRCDSSPYDEYGTIALTYNLENVTTTGDDTFNDWCQNEEANLKVMPNLKVIAKRISKSLADENLMQKMKNTPVSENSFVLSTEEITYSKKGTIKN